MSLRNFFDLLMLGALWGASFLFMRVAAPEFGPLALIEVRVVIGAAFLFAWLAIKGELKTLKGRSWQFLVLGAINSAIPFSLFAYCTLTLTAGFSSILNSTVPLFGAVIAYAWFREKLAWYQILGLMLGFVGVVVLASAKNLSLQGDAIAIGAGLLAAILYAVAAHFSKRNLPGCPPLAVSCGSLIGASLILLPTMPVFAPSHLPTSKAWLCAFALGIACTGIAYVLYFRLIKNLGASRSITVAYLIPVFGVLWGYLFLHEEISIGTIIGGVIVLTGTTLVNRAPKPMPTAKNDAAS